MLTSPLAAQLRPAAWGDLVGQQHLVGSNGALSHLLTAQGFLTQSILLHGPPGTGKTTLARLLAKGGTFVELSALSAGVSALREEIAAAEKRRQTFDQRTVLFVDEIHRFAKNQQEALLSAVESGVVTLIGATTEHPGTNIVRALLSRCLVFELHPLEDADILTLCDRAMTMGLLGAVRELSVGAKATLLRHAAGDARRALNLLQAAASKVEAGGVVIDEDAIAASGVERVMNFDLDGDLHYDTISAFIKSVRGSDVDAALEYLAMMIAGGERPEFIGRRLMILAAEDVGLADPNALQVAVAAFQISTAVGMPEARIPLAEATIYLALAPKSNSAYVAIDRALERVAGENLKVPKHLTAAGRSEYIYPHDSDPPIATQRYRDVDVEYYRPGKLGYESEVAHRFASIKSILRGRDN